METALFHPVIDETFQELNKVINDFNDDSFNKIPFEGSWTAGQVCQHISMSNRGFLQLIRGDVIPTDRDPYQWVETIKHDFLDMNKKATSPPTVDPVMKDYDRNRILSSLSRVAAELSECLNTLDMTATCTFFHLPVYGFLTRTEATAFMLYHTQRHTRQLWAIRKKIS